MNETQTCEDRDYRCCDMDNTPADKRHGEDWYQRHLTRFLLAEARQPMCHICGKGGGFHSWACTLLR